MNARRLMPDSLLGRLVLFFALGLVALLGINMLLLDNIQKSYARQTRNDRIGAAASRFFLFDPLTKDQRETSLANMGAVQNEETWTVGMALLPSRPGWEENVRAKQTEAVLRERFARNNSKPPRFRFRLIDVPSDAPEDAYAVDILARTDPARFPLLEVAMELRDGAWLSVIQSFQLDDTPIVRIQRLQLIVVIAVFAVLLLGALVTVTRPLRRLARAAEDFGNRPELAAPFEHEELGTREMREVAHSFNVMRSMIQNNLAERDRMLVAMAHDLRTPLTRLQLRLEEVTPPEMRERLLASSLEIQSIVNQGMELAKSLRTSEMPVSLDIRALMRNMVADSAEEGADVTFHGSVDDGAVFVTARPLCLRRCVANILDNALRYAGGAEIRLTERSNAVVLEVLDNGPGIPEADMERIFEPYYRVESSRNRELGGTGLGLPIARNMAILDGGVLTLCNRPEGGLRVELRFPRMRKGAKPPFDPERKKHS